MTALGSGGGESRQTTAMGKPRACGWLFAAGCAAAGGIRAEAFAEQVQLQLNRQLQTGPSRQNALNAFVDLDQIVDVNAAQLGGLFDFFVLSLQNLSQSLLLFSDGFDQLTDGLAPAVLVTGRYGLNGFHRSASFHAELCRWHAPFYVPMEKSATICRSVGEPLLTDRARWTHLLLRKILCGIVKNKKIS